MKRIAFVILLALALALFVDVLKIALLKKARISKKNIAKLHRRLTGEDAPPKALAHKLRQVSRMVDVGVGKDYIIDRLRIDREIAVFLEGLFTMALVKTAV